MGRNEIDSIVNSTEQLTHWIYLDYDGSPGREIADIKTAGYQGWSAIDIGMLVEEFHKIKEENQALKMENQKLQEALNSRTDPDPIEFRDITRSQAKKEITKYFEDHHGKVIYPSDISEALNLSYFLVKEIIEELEDDKQIKRASG